MMSSHTRMAVVAGVAAFLSVLPLLALTEDWTWLAPAAIAIAIVTTLGRMLRRVRVPTFIVYLAQPIALLMWLGVLVASDVAWLGFIPNGAWADRLVALLDQGVTAIESQSVPVVVDDFTGLLMLLVAGAGVVAWLTDTLLETFKSPVITGAPLAACYVVAAIVLNGSVGGLWFMFPAAGYLALLVMDRRYKVMAWGRSATSSSRRSGAPRADSLVRTGRRVGIASVAAAIAIPAVLPMLSQGLLSNGAFGGGSGGDGDLIRTDNPMVSIYDNLNLPPDVEVIRYETNAERPSYLRLAVVDKFDGEKWEPANREVPNTVDDGLPYPPGLREYSVKDIQEHQYDIEITENLEVKWLPMPYPAQELDIEDEWRYDENTLDVVYGDSDETKSDFDYTVRSLNVQPTAKELNALSDNYPDDLEPLTELPDELDPRIGELARSITKGATTSFERAKAIEAYFRESAGADRFYYDTSTDLGDSADAIVEFLENRRGFCVQFATTMTVMARALDIPARVAVGWVPGSPDENDSDVWVVRGNEAHAWPELYFEGVGWLRFEPTPSARAGATQPAWSLPVSDGETSDSDQATSSASPNAESERPDLPQDRLDDLAGGSSTPQDPASRLPMIGLIVVGAGALLSIPRGIAWLQANLRWRRAGSDPELWAEAAWSDLREAARNARLTWSDADTPRMIGSQLADAADLSTDDRDALRNVVTTVEKARYSRHTPAEEGLREDVAALRRTFMRGRGTGVRMKAYLWPATTQDLTAALSRRVDNLADRIETIRESVRSRVFFTR